MKKISGFDLVMIIVFAVIALLGGAGWWYLSGQLAATQQTVSQAASDFDKYSSKEVYLPTANNVKTVQANIDLMHSQLDPLIHDRLQPPGNKLGAVEKEDTVRWKHDLDAEVGRLNAAAKIHGVTVPPNFYYGFSRYLNQNPGDEQTVVLSKQLLGVEEMANIFINAPVRSISTLRRTYEEDAAGAAASAGGAGRTDPDVLPGKAVTAPGEVYVAYPFEIEIECSTVGFRKVVDDLQKSAYIFIVRSAVVQNSNPTSPQIGDLDKLAGTDSSAPAVAETSPGAVGASKPARGPQFLFGNETIHIKIRIDMIEWKGISNGSPAPEARPGSRGGRTGGGGAARAGGGGGEQ